VDNDGDPLVTGALYYRTTAPIGMKVWDGSQWLEASAAQQASFVTYEYIATAGQTTFTGNDANGVALSYIQGGVVVSINGVVQNPGDDYTATNGTSIVLTVGAALNDEIMVLAFRTFEVANTYTQAQADSRFVRTDGGNGVTLASGNLGLGVTPSAWLSGYAPVFENRGGTILAPSNTQLQLFANAFLNSSAQWVRRNAGFAGYYNIGAGAHEWHIAGNSTAGSTISWTQAMTLDASGNLGVGTTSPTARLEVRNNATAPISWGGTGSFNNNYGSLTWGDGLAIVQANAGYSLVFNTNGNTERARIDSSGNLLVGSTVASVTSGLGFKFIWGGSGTNPFMGIVTDQSTNGNANYHLYSTGAGAYRFYVGNGGTIFATSTSISAISDRTLKENIRDLETGLTEVMALKPRRFDWKNGDAQNVAGFVAQEVEEVLPELVTDYVYNKDEGGNDIIKKSLKMGDILPTLVKAIQEQQAIITALTARVTALEAQ